MIGSSCAPTQQPASGMVPAWGMKLPSQTRRSSIHAPPRWGPTFPWNRRVPGRVPLGLHHGTPLRWRLLMTGVVRGSQRGSPSAAVRSTCPGMNSTSKARSAGPGCSPSAAEEVGWFLHVNHPARSRREVEAPPGSRQMRGDRGGRAGSDAPPPARPGVVSVLDGREGAGTSVYVDDVAQPGMASPSARMSAPSAVFAWKPREAFHHLMIPFRRQPESFVVAERAVGVPRWRHR